MKLQNESIHEKFKESNIFETLFVKIAFIIIVNYLRN